MCSGFVEAWGRASSDQGLWRCLLLSSHGGTSSWPCFGRRGLSSAAVSNLCRVWNMEEDPSRWSCLVRGWPCPEWGFRQSWKQIGCQKLGIKALMLGRSVNRPPSQCQRQVSAVFLASSIGWSAVAKSCKVSYSHVQFWLESLGSTFLDGHQK